MMREEARMYIHHHRIRRREDGYLRNMYYDIFQQVVRMDPVMRPAHFYLRPNLSYEMVSFPTCARVLTDGVPQLTVYEGDM